MTTTLHTAKSLLVTGDTFHHREELKGLGGLYNKQLHGWIFCRRTQARMVGGVQDYWDGCSGGKIVWIVWNCKVV